MPYRTLDDRIDGLVLTFTETTTAKLLERDLRATAGQLQTFLDHLAVGYALCATIPGPGGEVGPTLPQADSAIATAMASNSTGLMRARPATERPRPPRSPGPCRRSCCATRPKPPPSAPKTHRR